MLYICMCHKSSFVFNLTYPHVPDERCHALYHVKFNPHNTETVTENDEKTTITWFRPKAVKDVLFCSFVYPSRTLRHWRPHAACWRSRWWSWNLSTTSCWRRRGSGRLGEVPWRMKKAKLRDAPETCKDCWTMRSRTGNIHAWTLLN